MATELIPATSRANRGLQVLRELKSKPHRAFMAGPVHTSNDVQNLDLFTISTVDSDDVETLEVHSNKGTVYQAILEDLNLSERTSNGSFISDKISDEGVFNARIK